MTDRIVIIPTYNEKENIETIIRKVFSLDIDFDILVVEDNLVNQKLIKLILSKIGYECDFAINGVVALEMVNKMS